MYRLTESLKRYLWKLHKEKLSLILFGHIEVLTDEIVQDYLEWCQTDEGKQYLKGGEKYKEPY